MAFCDLKTVRIFDEASGCTYIIGDVFSVYSFGAEKPVVYSWDMVKSVELSKRTTTIDVGKKNFRIDNKLFSSHDDFLRAIALIECACRDYDIPYAHDKRIFPTKNLYNETIVGKDAYVGEGEVDENDIASAFIMMMNLKLVKFLWLIAILMMLVIFGLLHLFIGVTRSNLLYFIPISFAGGGIITLIVYIVCYGIAKNRFKSIIECDPAAGSVMTFVISRLGFAVCEKCNYDGGDLVAWNEADYFVETDKMFIIYKNNVAIAYIPKKVFNKKHIGGISDIIALRLEQR